MKTEIAGLTLCKALRRVAVGFGHAWSHSVRGAIAALLVLAVPAYAQERTLTVLLEGDKLYPKLNISATGRDGSATLLEVKDCPDFDSDLFIGAFRFEVELAMICNVVRDYDLADRFEFASSPNNARVIADVAAGRADLVGESVFKTAVGPDAKITEPVLRIGDFKVGVFTTPSRTDVLEAKTPDQLRNLRGVTVNSWNVDLKTLKGMGLGAIVSARTMDLIPGMISAGRADFTLSYLDRSTTDHMGARLQRVDGFRVTLTEARVLLFAPQHGEIVNAFDAFIKANRAAAVDRIENAYKRAGFIVDQYDDWYDVTYPPN